MEYYQCKAKRLAGTSYKEVWKNAWVAFDLIKRRTKRKPYVRSEFFGKKKVFFDNFWTHLAEKPRPERMRRLRFFRAAIELIEKTKVQPNEMVNPAKKSERLYRFRGRIGKDEYFFVQIKEGKNKRKQFMSCFPEK